jgi:hypothetical protein
MHVKKHAEERAIWDHIVTDTHTHIKGEKL